VYAEHADDPAAVPLPPNVTEGNGEIVAVPVMMVGSIVPARLNAARQAELVVTRAIKVATYCGTAKNVDEPALLALTSTGAVDRPKTADEPATCIAIELTPRIDVKHDVLPSVSAVAPRMLCKRAKHTL
jgi:hypothetical protein